jgi:hypothetical protein
LHEFDEFGRIGLESARQFVCNWRARDMYAPTHDKQKKASMAAVTARLEEMHWSSNKEAFVHRFRKKGRPAKDKLFLDELQALMARN